MSVNIMRLVFIVLAAAGLVASRVHMDRIEQRSHSVGTSADSELGWTDGAESPPPTLAVITFALGPLRSIVVNVLSWRAIRQQDQGEYFDALQLASWIANLQPNFASIWAFHGWNIAYNISHEFATPEERWEWIWQAITLLRDGGLRYNPGNAVIRQELSRLFYHRIANKMDPGAEYYKNQWTFHMMRYLLRGDREELEKLVAAAETKDALLQRPHVQEYVDVCLEAGIDVFDVDTNPPRLAAAYVELPRLHRRAAAHEIYYYYRRLYIAQDLKLDVRRMLAVDRRYGPLDWRLHQAHALYWGAEDRAEDYRETAVNYSKIVRQVMLDSFYEGRLIHDPERNFITRTNNLDIIGSIHDQFEWTLEHMYNRHDDMLHKQFLERAITVLFSFDRHVDSRELFDHYKADYDPNGALDYESFVIASMRSTLSANVNATRRSLIESALYKSFSWLYIGDNDRSNGFYNLAQLLWQQNQQQFVEQPARLLPPFDELVRIAQENFAGQRGMNPSSLQARQQNARRRTQAKRVDTGRYERGKGTKRGTSAQGHHHGHGHAH